jgi:hypothetical protein
LPVIGRSLGAIVSGKLGVRLTGYTSF